MKKFRNWVIGGIETKVIVLLLISMLLVAAVSVASRLVEANMLAQLT